MHASVCHNTIQEKALQVTIIRAIREQKKREYITWPTNATNFDQDKPVEFGTMTKILQTE